jgi:hypothetical protein
MRRGFLMALVICAAMSAEVCVAQELRVPASVTAGDDTNISTTGSGKATFYLAGPGISQKSDVNLGDDIRLPGKDLQDAGQYLAVLCSSTCDSASFFVSAAKPNSLAFMVHPSRVPVAENQAVSGVAFPFDQYRNLVLAPETVTFELASKNAPAISKSTRTQGGVAWFRTASGRSAGLVQISASLGDVTEKRALQQVASDPCNLRIKGERTAKGIFVETDPVHDCTGNIVPDGTIISFTASDATGKSTVDAPVKAGVAKAQIEGSGPTVISVASGVVMGNELRIGGQP